MTLIGLIPNVSGTGGMVSFRHKLTAGLNERGIQVTTDLSLPNVQSVLIIGGTRQLGILRQLKARGIRLVQRLDGINWLQRRKRTGLRHFLRAEIGNYLQNTIRTRLADHIIYQSRFAQNWWQDWYGIAQAPVSVIYNGVDLQTYSPLGAHDRPKDKTRILMVEGSFSGGYDAGLENAVALVETLNLKYSLRVELMVVGGVSPDLQSHWQARCSVPIHWQGVLPRQAVPETDRSAHLLFAADLQPACPNSVIEALACGLPVAAFATGAISELVPENAGAVVPYGSDPWKLQKPDIPSLAERATQVLQDQNPTRQNARTQAEDRFSLDGMVDQYLKVLLEGKHEQQ